MTAKFLVVECDDNETALEMVRLMLDRGYARLMLLDDLSKHPSLNYRRSTEPIPPCSTETSRSNNSAKESVQPRKSAYPRADREKEQKILELLQMSASEGIPFPAQPKVEACCSTEDDSTGECFADSEEQTSNDFHFDFSASDSVNAQLDLLAQAQCLVGSSSPSDCAPPAKKQRSSVSDPEKDYHTCQLCGTRVKAPRGGRWNLQMHVMAMHSVKRPFKCAECSFTDYRKPGMRKHTILTHGKDLEPIDISTPEKRAEWDSVMGECFPEFAYRTGFLPDTRPNPVLPGVNDGN